MRKEPISIFIAIPLLLTMLLETLQFGSDTAMGAGVGVWTSTALDGSGNAHIGYREEGNIESLPSLCEMFDFEVA